MMTNSPFFEEDWNFGVISWMGPTRKVSCNFVISRAMQMTLCGLRVFWISLKNFSIRWELSYKIWVRLDSLMDWKKRSLAAVFGGRKPMKEN